MNYSERKKYFAFTIDNYYTTYYSDFQLFNSKISALHETYPEDFCNTESSVFKQVKVFAYGDREEFSVVSGGVVFYFFLGSAGFSFEFFKSPDGYDFSGFSK